VTDQTRSTALPLTGERTVPGVARENYWFRRHEVVYEWITRSFALSGADLIEAGCGEGYGADTLRRAGSQVTALDYDDQTISHVKSKYVEVTAVHANLDSFPVSDESADLLVSLQVFEHLWNTGKFLAEVRRSLRPQGIAIISTPNRVTFSPGVGRGEKPTNPFHVEEFDGTQLRDILIDAGFSSVEVGGLHHGARLAKIETESGDIVARQLSAINASDNWPSQLLDEVGSVSASDFDIRDDFQQSLDLIAVARR
jgi:SAM-dependent methyltransferase